MIVKYVFGAFRRSEIEVANKATHVEYRVIDGHCDESDARAAAGNYGRWQYAFSYSGHYQERKRAIDRLKADIEEAKRHLEELEFSLKVTKKKKWIEVE